MTKSSELEDWRSQLRWRACFAMYSLGLVLLTICVMHSAKHPPSLVDANFGPRGNERTAKTPHKLLVDYIDRVREGDEFNLLEANSLVHYATRHVGRRDVSFSENWVQWIAGQFYSPMLQTQDSNLLIEGRLGNCSDRCQILKTVAELSGKRCRFVGLSGHVVLEVEIDNAWYVADPDYNVTFDKPVESLARPEQERQLRSRLEKRYRKSVVDEYVRILQTVDDNIHLPIGSALSPRLYVAEKACKVASWLLPSVFIIASIPLIRLGS